jgi:hypothetical protein
LKRDALETDKILVTFPIRWKSRIREKAEGLAVPGNKPNVQDVWRWSMAVALFPEECVVQKKEVKE